MIAKIISGGQTGVDRGGLDFAIRNGIPHGGWCPKGRRDETKGKIPLKYDLKETGSHGYTGRTAKNVQTADGTLILTRGTVSGGTELTVGFCDSFSKPRFIIDLNRPLSHDEFWAWVAENKISTMNVAGPRESKQPGIRKQTVKTLEKIFENRPA
jgi:hypothetical protein